MTYGQFKKECKKSELARLLYNIWLDRKAPLYPIIDLYNKIIKV